MDLKDYKFLIMFGLGVGLLISIIVFVGVTLDYSYKKDLLQMLIDSGVDINSQILNNFGIK